MNRKAFFLAACCLVPGLALAADSDGLLRSLRHCASLTDASARLSCYDQLAPLFEAGQTQGNQAAAAPPPPTREQKESWFGLDSLFGGGEEKPQTTPEEFGEERVKKSEVEIAKAKEQEVNKITARLTDYMINPYGRFTVFLDNGQIWTQLKGDTDQAHFPKDPRKVTVTVERGVFGSYSMTISGNPKLFKVKRLK